MYWAQLFLVWSTFWGAHVAILDLSALLLEHNLWKFALVLRSCYASKFKIVSLKNDVITVRSGRAKSAIFQIGGYFPIWVQLDAWTQYESLKFAQHFSGCLSMMRSWRECDVNAMWAQKLNRVTLQFFQKHYDYRAVGSLVYIYIIYIYIYFNIDSGFN